MRQKILNEIEKLDTEFGADKEEIIRNSNYDENEANKILDELQIKYIQQKGFLVNHDTFIIVDFYLCRPYKICIEIDGSYHTRSDMQYKDKYKDDSEFQKFFDLEKEKSFLYKRITPILFDSLDNIDLDGPKYSGMIEQHPACIIKTYKDISFLENI